METGHRIQHIVEERSDLDRIYLPESVLNTLEIHSTITITVL